MKKPKRVWLNIALRSEREKEELRKAALKLGGQYAKLGPWARDQLIEVAKNAA